MRLSPAAVASCVCASLLGCAGGNHETASAPAPSPLQVETTSAVAGVGWQSRGSERVVFVREFTGPVEDLVWQPGAKDAALLQCLEGLQLKIRFATPEDRASAGFLRSLVDRCAKDAGLGDPRVDPHPDASRYRIHLQTSPGDRLANARGPALQTTGAGQLGGARLVSRGSVTSTQVRADAEACASAATAGGILTESRMQGTPQDGWTVGVQSVSIAPLLDRFDACLRERGYTVEQPGAQPATPASGSPTTSSSGRAPATGGR